ncbi:MAG TPA: hypothetical protein VHD15_04335 [Hyphomicrobiales bacterium]|nr:hypothetical protein [Hyphomicrobiales bacterium]
MVDHGELDAKDAIGIRRVFKYFLSIPQPKVEAENGLNEKALVTLLRGHDELRVHRTLSGRRTPSAASEPMLV